MSFFYDSPIPIEVCLFSFFSLLNFLAPLAVALSPSLETFQDVAVESIAKVQSRRLSIFTTLSIELSYSSVGHAGY